MMPADTKSKCLMKWNMYGPADDHMSGCDISKHAVQWMFTQSEEKLIRGRDLVKKKKNQRFQREKQQESKEDRVQEKEPQLEMFRACVCVTYHSCSVYC